MHYYFGRFVSLLGRLWSVQQVVVLRPQGGKVAWSKVFMTLQGCDARVAYKSNKFNKKLRRPAIVTNANSLMGALAMLTLTVCA